ncbi:hypothetical protein ABB37_06092 [Leptomonas pyrrhocoris]|uniref:Uncharacterized protein n=1 Tax=Leptomonas pyrrhocoris TaxID=157538 RepID=A0A0M9FY25_LEPPY|nr:hypothetical protein ABB37_06092 [Leptomonas pyrrhocoris]KPA78470.1 hypothetical protein ABB37_06092 [Leptomonas pyrrhocoris]|eukprot:XP_015656909.1 hypothetical protein ABB37_06092 [Leptomonas pyrrhocoris]
MVSDHCAGSTTASCTHFVKLLNASITAGARAASLRRRNLLQLLLNFPRVHTLEPGAPRADVHGVKSLPTAGDAGLLIVQEPYARFLCRIPVLSQTLIQELCAQQASMAQHQGTLEFKSTSYADTTARNTDELRTFRDALLKLQAKPTSFPPPMEHAWEAPRDLSQSAAQTCNFLHQVSGHLTAALSPSGCHLRGQVAKNPFQVLCLRVRGLERIDTR